MADLLIHNLTKDRSTRGVRARSPEHHRSTLFLFGASQRVLPSRPLPVTTETLQKHLKEVSDLVSKGKICITTPDRRPFDLATFDAAKAPPSPPLPAFLPDSLARDGIHAGVNLSAFGGEAPVPDVFEMPVAPPVAAIENPTPEFRETAEEDLPKKKLFKKGK